MGKKIRYVFSDCNKDFIRCNKAAAQHVERKIWPLSAAEGEADAERGKWAVSRQQLWTRQHIRAETGA